MRSLAQFFARIDPEILALCEIDAGNALSLATRFVRHYAYRGGQALFLKSSIAITAVRDEHVPLWPSRPFDRRGVVCVKARHGNGNISILTAKIAREREQRAAEIRHLRNVVRALETPAVLFINLPHQAALHFPGYERVAFARPLSERIYQSGFVVRTTSVEEAPHHGMAAPVGATLSREA